MIEEITKMSIVNKKVELSELYQLIGELPRPYSPVNVKGHRRSHGTSADYIAQRLRAERKPYAFDRPKRHLEECSRCHEFVAAGYLEIVYPDDTKEERVPYIALHWLKEHDSLFYSSDEQTGRMPITRLRGRLLRSRD